MGIVRHYIIKDQECGYLTKNGKFIKLLTAGRYSFVKALGYEVDIVPMTGEVRTCGIPEEILMGDKGFADRVVKNVLPDECIALRFVNKAYREVLTKPESLFWNVFEENEFRIIDITRPCMEESLPRFYMDLMPARYYKKIIVKDGEIGLLYYDNRYEKRLETGTYYFWNYGKEVTCKIVNPEKLVRQVEGAASQIYTCVQLKLREYVGRYRLDELLAQKEEIGAYVLERLKEYQEEYCVEITGAGIKDIILPGEIREIMNTVLVAEKKAQANVIMRREEVASTRSLLNTAKLMDENRTLFKLKEMEYLERICDKVGNITLNGGKGVLEQLAELAGTEKH